MQANWPTPARVTIALESGSRSFSCWSAAQSSALAIRIKTIKNKNPSVHAAKPKTIQIKVMISPNGRSYSCAAAKVLLYAGSKKWHAGAQTIAPLSRERALGLMQDWSEVLSGRSKPTTH